MSGGERHEERRDPHGENESGHQPCGDREAAPEPDLPGRTGSEPEGRGERDGRGPGEGDPAGSPDSTVPAASTAPAASAAPGPVDLAELDERALRLMLRGAVEDVEPAPDALERLHHAVPARRARRRQLTAGAVAAALVIGVATPVLMQSGVITRVLDGNTTNAASSQRHQEEAKAGGQGGSATEQEAGQYTGGGDGGEGRTEPEDRSEEDATAAPETNDTLGPTSPSCMRSQLGDGGSTVSPADADGHVYGSFRVTNISDSSCRVQGPDTVTAAPAGSADPTGFSVVDHTTGDRASRLPDPRLEPGSFVLEPGQSYAVRFAWLPREGGGTTGCAAAPDPSPTPGDPTGGTGTGGGPGGTDGGAGGTGDPTGGTGTGGGTTPPDSGQGSEGGDTVEEPVEGGGISPQLAYDTGGAGGGATAASVVLRYVPAAGEPRIGKVEITGACAGTVYRTGPIPAS